MTDCKRNILQVLFSRQKTALKIGAQTLYGTGTLKKPFGIIIFTDYFDTDRNSVNLCAILFL